MILNLLTQFEMKKHTLMSKRGEFVVCHMMVLFDQQCYIPKLRNLAAGDTFNCFSVQQSIEFSLATL